ncbi:MAG: GLPGLI family protein [Flavobacterium sp.]|nr:GLPGLI family protein [Flavobacterium sp.]
MTTKIILSYTIILVTLFSFSQNINHEATYRIYIQEEINKKYSSEMVQEQETVKNATKKVILKLVFNESKAMYFVDHGLNDPINDFNYSMALTYSLGETPYYTDKNRGISFYNNLEDEFYKQGEFLVTDSIPKWKLTNETKKINNYTCYKATYEKEYPYYADKVLKTITAWYCPEFPYSYGPKGFGGLPGLIFEVQDDKTVIGIESIVLNNNDKEIILPTKGKVITNVDFYIKLYKSIKEYIDSIKSKD